MMDRLKNFLDLNPPTTQPNMFFQSDTVNTSNGVILLNLDGGQIERRHFLSLNPPTTQLSMFFKPDMEKHIERRCFLNLNDGLKSVIF